MPFFHRLSQARSFTSPWRALGVYPPRRARPVRRFAHSPLRSHDPQFSVHNFKNRNPISIPHLSHFTSPNLLQMHQTRHRPSSSHAHTPSRPYPTPTKAKQTHQNRRNEPKNPLAASKSPFSTGHRAQFLTKQSQTRPPSPHHPFLTLLPPSPILRDWPVQRKCPSRPRAITLHKMNFERSLVSWH